jgi:8-oxo-dGTP pyrophosphatase MutT (NUDIX family)
LEKQSFPVSIKGILYENGNYLLRKNERNEYELLGGKLEFSDETFEQRLHEEFLEESGVEIQFEAIREPWLYMISEENIIIIPFICSSMKKYPKKLYDNDGGTVGWIKRDELDTIHMPYGYKDSIRDVIPRKSFSHRKGEYFKSIPHCTEQKYHINIVVKNLKGETLFDDYLYYFNSPREFLKKKLKNRYVEENLFFSTVDKKDDVLVINYVCVV